MQQTRRFSVRTLVYCALFFFFFAVGAFIQIPAPLMDYFTLQFLFVLLAGMVLGPYKGAAAVLVYLIIGLVGFPVFAAGGGISYVLRPTFGYLIGFVVTAFITGWIAQKGDGITRKYMYYVLAAFAGMIATHVIGISYKYLILNLYTKETTALWSIIAVALPLEIPSDFAFCLLTAAVGPRLRKIFLESENA